MEQLEKVEESGGAVATPTGFILKPKKRKMNDMEKKGLAFTIVVLTPVIISFLIFWVYANIQSICLGFMEKDMATGKEIFSLYQFEKLFREFKNPNSAMSEAFVNTMQYFVVHLIKLFWETHII